VYKPTNVGVYKPTNVHVYKPTNVSVYKGYCNYLGCHGYTSSRTVPDIYYMFYVYLSITKDTDRHYG